MGLRAFWTISLTTLLAACGASTANIVPSRVGFLAPAGFVSGRVSGGDVTLPIEILDPRATALTTSKNVTYVSPATRSFSLDFTIGGELESSVSNVGRGIKGCHRDSSGILCRISLPAGGGTSFEFRTYDRPLRGNRPSGHLLNYGAAHAAGRNETLAFAMETVAASATVASVDADPPSGKTTDLHLRFVVRDPDEYPIVGGTYVDTSGFVEPVTIGYTTQPATYSSFSITVNGKQSPNVSGPSDRYDVKYIGEGVVTGLLTLEQSVLKLGSTTIAPLPRNISVPGAPKGVAASSLVVPAPGVEYFLESSGKIGSLKGMHLTEMTVPSGNTPELLAFAYYEAPFIELVFATKQNTLGTVDNQHNFTESAAVPGSPITGIDDSASPAYVQSAGTFGQEYNGNPTAATYQVPGTPRLTGFADNDGYAFADPGNHAVGFMGLIIPFFTYFYETPVPSGSPAFVAAGPNQSIWVALAGQPGGYIMNVHGEKTKPLKFESSAPLTSMTLVAPNSYYNDEPMAATDAKGNVELFDASGNLLHTFVPSGGAASDITAASDTTLYYICSSCRHGIQQLIY